MNLGQLIYTSFPGIGFQSLASDQIPSELQAFFLKQVVLKHWNAYRPDDCCHRAIYLHQLAPESTLFGWLYCDEVDEYNRNIPYFIGYHLTESLNAEYLQEIFTCLQRGPAIFFDRHRTNQTIHALEILDAQTYEPARRGFDLAQELYEDSLADLENGELINLLLFEHEEASDSNNCDSTVPPDNVEPLRPDQPLNSVAPRDVDALENILQTLIDKPVGVQCAFLVSAQGQPLTPPAGMDTNSALILSGAMIYLMQSTCAELQWQEIKKICIQANEGNIVLAQCSADVFLVLQTNPTLMGLLDGEINRTVQKLRLTLQQHNTQGNLHPVPQIINDPQGRHLAAV